jgi:TPR repeat protein
MAVRYFNGTGVPQDYLHARYWCMKAAENGVDEARLLMARFYLEALGVERDEAEGVAWVAEAAVQKGKTARQAQAMLGSLFQRGVGVERDLKMAYVWYSVAAANGDGGAPISRDLVAKGLSADELDEAQALAGQYFERFNTKS